MVFQGSSITISMIQSLNQKQKVQFVVEPLEVWFWCHLLGKFLGLTICRKGIDLDSANAKAIQDMEPSMTYKQLKSFIGRTSYVRRFIPPLAELLKPFHRLLKMNVTFKWHQKQQAIESQRRLSTRKNIKILVNKRTQQF